jgi:hypothetical protein
LDETSFHVLLDGRMVGPYDRRTIVGMRIRKTLTSEHVLVGTDGAKLTVAELIGQRPATPFAPERSGSFSLVNATFAAALLDVSGEGADIPAFKGELEARVQSGVLRLAGRFRKGLRWKEDRVKLALADVVHARVRNSQVELWLRNAAGDANAPLQRITFEMFTHEAAGELVDWLPAATPYPESAGRDAVAPDHRALWVAGLAVGAVVLVVLVLLVVGLGPRKLF